MNTLFTLSITLFASLGLSDQAPPAKEAKPEETVRIEDRLLDTDTPDRMWNRPCKVHIVHLTAGKAYLVTMTKKDNKQTLNPFFRVEDSKFQPIVGMSFGRAQITPAKDDDYRFVATSNWGNGEYVLKIKPSNLAKIKTYEPGKVHDVGNDDIEYQSNLGAKDVKDTKRNTCFAKVFDVKLFKGRTYTLDMESKQLDSYLRVENSDRKQLAEDDDSGGNLNARIIFQAPADGTYRIIATTYAAGMAGAFTLRIHPD